MSLEVRTYSSKKNQHGLGQTLKTMWKEFPEANALGFRFAERGIKTKYRQSVFGMFWAFLPPLATASIWIILDNYNVIKFKNVGGSYPMFVITGMMLWSVFTNSILMPMQTVQANRSILVKINFPRESLIFNAFYEILFNAAISFVIILVCLLIFKVPVTFSCLYFFPVLFVIIFLGMAIGLLLLPFSFLYKDIQFILPSVLQLAMYLTPVVYSPPVYKGIGKLLLLNPVSPLVTSARSWLLGVDFSVPIWHIGLVALITVFLFIIGIFLQKITMQILIERMGS